MGARRDRAVAIATRLTAAGVRASADIAEAMAQLPVVLIPPPALVPSMDGFTATWRLTAIASNAQGAAVAWDQLDDLVDAVDAELHVERADPSSYQLPGGSDALPAYVLIYTENIGG